MREITIKDNVYSVDKLSGRQQFHVARRLAPALFGMAKSAVELGSTTMPEDMKMISAFEPLVQVMSRMTDADADYILDSCLSVVKRRQMVSTNVSWAAVFIPGSGATFQDMDMTVQLQLAYAVIQDNMGNFMSALSANSPDGATPILNS